MTSEQYLYQDRAVVFLDVLGFQEKLIDFENQAVQYNEDNNYFYSESVNEFIETFKSVVGFLDKNNFNFYLFSDNICITIDYSENQNRLIEILVAINDLFFKFAQKGYFLRGGVDVGKFVDVKEKEKENKIAVGVPLATAYKLEQDVAMYPRIVISNNYKKLLDSFEESKLINEDSITKKKYLIKQHCEVYYINTFFNLLNNENKIEIVEGIKKSIEENLLTNSMKERVAIKYEWLANEFNSFIDEYVNELIYLETETPEEEEIQKVKSLKIKEYVQ